ncbi:MAG TPA: hypothetical protein VF168_10110 [Trueperaceae bacterium]
MSRLVLTSLLLSLLPLSLAQTAEFAVAYPAPEAGNRRVEVVFADVPVGDNSAGLRLAYGDELGLGVRMRQAGSLATIGNLIASLAADANSAGRFAVAFTARGVLGPAAVRLRASVYDGGPPLAPLAEGDFSELPLLGQGPAVMGLEAGVSYRVSRALIVDVAPGVYLRSGELGLSLTGEARLVRLHGSNDLSLLLSSFTQPGFDRTTLALGAAYTINRRRAPSWELAAWLGLGPDGLAPGAVLHGGERFGAGELDLLAAAEPYRIDAWPYRLQLGYERDVGVGDLEVGAMAGLEPRSGWRAGGRLAYRIPFEP